MSAGGSGDIDPEIVRAGGKEFAQRLAQFKAAKDGAEAALANLKIGKDARIAYDNAQKLIEDGKAQVAAMIAEAEAKSQSMIAAAEVTLARAEDAKRRAKAEVSELAAHLKKVGQDAGIIA
jgi:hypothetical protein